MRRSERGSIAARARLGAAVTLAWSMLAPAAIVGAQLPVPSGGTTVRDPSAPRPTVTGAANTSGVRQLMCRGGPGAFHFAVTANPSPRVRSYVEMRVEYRRGVIPPGGNWTTLEPGTCSWNDRTGRLVEPGYVLLDTHANAQPAPSAEQRQQQILHGTTQPAPDLSAAAAENHPDTLSIPRYLSDLRHFWVFYVHDAGPQVAISHGAYRPTVAQQVTAQEIAAPTTPTTRSVTEARRVLRDVQVTPEVTAATVRFTSGPSESPVVQLSKGPVLRDLAGHKSFAQPIPVPVARTAFGANGSGYAARAVGLDHYTRYFYLIEIPGDSLAPAQQLTGQFTTLRQAVRVVFTEIQILDDSDDDGNGELSFSFYAGQPMTGVASLGSMRAPLDWKSGSTHAISTAWATGDAPDRLRLLVLGMDDDAIGSNKWMYDPTPYEQAAAGSNQAADWNVAKGEFDLRKPADRSFAMPFMLRAVNASLAFEVRGRLEVTR